MVVIRGLDGQPVPEAFWEEMTTDSYRVKPYMPRATVIDVGANVGAFTIWALLEGARKVYAIEPFHENVRCLTSNLLDNDVFDAVVIEAAVGPPDVEECDVLWNGWSTGVQTIPGKGIPVMSFHDVVELSERIDVMKIDCEGAEYGFILSASDEDLKKVQVIALEFHVWTLNTEPRKPGLGVRGGTEHARSQALVNRLWETHDLEVYGNVDAGGYMLGRLR